MPITSAIFQSHWLCAIDGIPAATPSSSISNAYIYFPSGIHRVKVHYEAKITDYSNYNSLTNTQTVVTLSGYNLEYTHDFLPHHTYQFDYANYDGQYLLVLIDVSDKKSWETPEIAPTAPKSGEVTNWDFPVNNSPLFIPIYGLGFDAGFSKIKRLVESESYIGGIADFGKADFSGQMFLQGGLGLNAKDWGISIIPELGGGFGTFYTAQWHYAFIADVYFKNLSAGFGWGTFQGAGAGFSDITAVPTPFLQAILTYNFWRRNYYNSAHLGIYFDYYYENDSIGIGLRWVANNTGSPTLIRKTLN